MKKKYIAPLLLSFALALVACGNQEQAADAPTQQPVENEIVVDDKDPFEIPEYKPADQEEVLPEEEEIVEPEEVIPEGMYRSELTGEWISEELRDQRPIAVMVDNEKTALDHFGVNDCDIVYEMMNSVLNNRVTRLMCIKKDWVGTQQLGSVRSARPTNFMVAAEYNAILIHDGGPFYIDNYAAQGYTNNLSGGFGRFTNGKHWEYTEYVTYDTYTNPDTGKSYDGLAQRIERAKYSTTYNDYYPGPHFQFAAKEQDLTQWAQHQEVLHIELPFPHNESMLDYDPETQTYAYSEYGKPHIDPLDDNRQTTFKNVILQSCSFYQYDDHGYMIYNIEGGSGEGYYISDGYAIPITWSKNKQADLTVYKDEQTGEDLTLNIGKTYIGIVPSDKWNTLVLEGSVTQAPQEDIQEETTQETDN